MSPARPHRIRPAVLVALAIAPLAVALSSNAAIQCEVLSALLPSQVAALSSAAYNASLASYFWQQEQQMHPGCIFMPCAVDDVQIAITTLTAIFLIDPADSLVAIRSGGHGIVPGASNDNGGLTIDLSQLDDITINENQTIVSIGAGARWEDVYAVLDPLNLTVSGGRVAGIGLGGYFTGGGISYFSAARGWACDAILGMEVVLAGGEVVYATKTSYPDLFTALQGGSNNLGIVTRFDVATFPLGEMLGGVIAYPVTTASEQLQALVTFMAPSNFDPDAAVIQAFVWSATTGQLISNNLEYSQANANPASLQQLATIQPQYENTERLTTLLDIVEEQATFFPPDVRVLYANTVFRPTLPVLEEIISIWNASIASIEAVPGLGLSVIFQRLPTTLSTNVNLLGLPSDAHSLLLCLITLTWASSADDALVNSFGENLLNSFEQVTKAAGVFNQFKYLNYAGAFQDPLDSYGAANKAKLIAASKKYDPAGFFQKAVPGGFKLS